LTADISVSLKQFPNNSHQHSPYRGLTPKDGYFTSSNLNYRVI
jgi:hypothetical protein